MSLHRHHGHCCRTLYRSNSRAARQATSVFPSCIRNFTPIIVVRIFSLLRVKGIDSSMDVSLQTDPMWTCARSQAKFNANKGRGTEILLKVNG